MPQPRVQIVHIRLEILDDAALICRRKVGTRMGKLKGADGGIMGLQDGFKIERQSIPERELSAG